MTYQPKSYRKFVATAATATLVATAFAPFASAHSFKDVETKYEEAVNFLVSKGVSGYPDGTFKTQKTITRLEAAEMLGKALGLDKVTDAPASGFTDVPARVATLINAFKAKGITSGKTATTFAPNAEITRGELAVWIQKAYDLKAKEGSTNKFTDVADNYKAAVQAFVDNKIASGTSETTFGTTTSAKRGDFALFVKRAADAAVVKEVAVESVSAINANSLKVTFNTSIKDTTKAVFEVKKGSVKVNTSTIMWNKEKTEATIELTGKITAGEYTVNVTGLAEAALTGSVTAQDEKVEAVEILSETAPLTNVASGSKTVTVGYKVVNQYGEDITTTTALTVTAGGTSYDSTRSSSLVASKGQVTIPVVNEAREGDAIVLTLVNTASGKSVSQTVKVAAQSAVANVAITGIYNKDGKTLTETTDVNRDAFYLLVEAKDQYGKVLKENQIVGLIGNNTNGLIAGINGGNNPVVETITVEGKEVTAIKVTGPVKAGSTQVMLIAPASGKNATYTINVTEAKRTDVVTFQIPELVVAKEKLFVPISVIDKEGKAVTDLETIKDTVRGIQISGVNGVTTAANVKVEKGQVGIEIEAGNAALTNEGYISLVAVSSTGKSAIANIQVRKAAEATIVTGVKEGTSTTLLTGQQVKLSAANLAVEDQYGRVMTEAALKAWLGISGNEIVVKDTTAGTVTLSATDSASSTGDNTVTIAAATHSATLTGGTKGTEKVSVTLKNSTGPIATSTKEFSFQVTDGTEYTSYEVAEIGTLFDEVGADLADDTKYSKTVKVYGVLANGSKVLLNETNDFTISTPSYISNTAGTLDVGTTTNLYKDKETELKGNVVVTINATGQQFTKEVTVSKAKPKVSDFKVVAEGAASKITTKALFDKAEEVTELTSAAFTSTAVNSLVDFVIVDNYGAVHSLATGVVATDLGNVKKIFVDNVNLVASPLVANTITFTEQNDPGLKFAGLEKGESFTVKATVGGVTKTFKVVGTLDTVSQLNAAKVAVDTAAPASQVAKSDDQAAAVKKIETAVKALTYGDSSALISADSNIKVSVIVDSFTAAGSTDGEIKFKVQLTKGNATVISKQFTQVISK